MPAPHTLGALRRRLMTPSIDETRVATRGFHVKSPEAVATLETVGASFLDGFGEAVGTMSVPAVEGFLDTVPARFRGFAAEGAGMGLAVLDALPPTRSDRVDEFLARRGDDHVYMVLVGVGWAMARLPRMLWPRADRLDPLLRWLVLDGYGFHQAYFHTAAYVHGTRPEIHLGWEPQDPHGYERRAADQGIGRALWFVAGTDPARAVELLQAYPEHRHADLWAGLGLAATYAGGSDAAELLLLLDAAGAHEVDLAQGSAFAAEARLRADLLVPHVGTATGILAGTDPTTAAATCLRTRPASAVRDAGGLPAFETWRRAIGEALTTGTTPSAAGGF